MGLLFKNYSRLHHSLIVVILFLFLYSSFKQKRNTYHQKITDIHLEDETLTLWRPSSNDWQYQLIPETICEEDWPNILQIYYSSFDCISSVLPFDDALPVIASQTTTLAPTYDYSVLRDYPRIRGLWYQPQKSSTVGMEDDSRVGNLKFSIFFPRSEKDNLLSQLNMYYLEVMDYESDDKSVSRFLLTRLDYPNLPRYDMFKPGGPIYVTKNDTIEGMTETYYFLKISSSFTGRIMDHVVEFMLEEDPWPMCHISPVTHKPFREPICILDLNESLGEEISKIDTRYIGSCWEDCLAGLFTWSLKTHMPWLVYERLHANVKANVNISAYASHMTEIIPSPSATLCNKKLHLLVDLNPFIIKCQNEKDLQEVLKLFLALHICSEKCNKIAIRHVNLAEIMPPYLSLLEKLFACNFTPLRREIASAMLPPSVMAYYFSDQKIDSCRKMIAYITQIDGLEQVFSSNHLNSTHDFLNSTYFTERTSGVFSLSDVDEDNGHLDEDADNESI